MKPLVAALGIVFCVAGAVYAEPIASVVAVRGTATINRGGKKLNAQPKLGIELQDTVTTAEGGRAKLLFIDDSVLTLAEKTSMSVDTFVHSRSDRGTSLFNLLDGKMRAVVGKTRFEVKTPTVVAAARGTVILFDVGTQNGRPFTRVTCLEGIVDVRSVTAAPGAKPVMLSPGQSIVVAAKPTPAPEQKSKAEKTEKSEKAEKSDKPTKSEQSSKPEPASQSEQSSQPEKSSKPESSSKPEPSSAPAPAPAPAPAAPEPAPVSATAPAPAPPVTTVATPEPAPVSTAMPVPMPMPVQEAPLPVPEQLSPVEIEKLKKDTNTSGPEIKVLPPPQPVPPTPPPVIPQIPQQPAKRQPTKVDIGVKF